MSVARVVPCTANLAVLGLCLLGSGAARAQPVEWIKRADSGPSGRTYCPMAYDSARGVTALFGGTVNGSTGLGDTWEWNGSLWTQRVVSGPSARLLHAMSYDAARGVTVLFGGWNGSAAHGDTWEWNGTAWTRRVVSGPAARYFHGMAYDTVRGVTVLFGGVTNSVVSGETWEWNGTAWTKRLVSGPSPRYAHAMVYDQSRGVTVLFGGFNAVSFGETWEWDGNAWTQRMVAGPSPRYNHAMAHDAARGVTVLFGGTLGSGDFDGETWEWNGTSWAQRMGTHPSTRSEHSMAYDSARGMVVLFGGSTPDALSAETWEFGCLALTEQPAPRIACPQGSAFFSLTAAGIHPFSYQWQVQDAPSGLWVTLGNDPLPLSCGGSAIAFATPINSPTVTIGIHPCPGDPTAPQHFQVRALVTNACGSATSTEATYTICPADFNCSSSVTVQDIFDFLAAYFSHLPSADFNNSGSSTVQDIFDFLGAYFTGCA